MSKPMGANPPPTSLRESEAMLIAEDYRRKAPGEWRMLGGLLGVTLSVIAALAGIVYWGLLLLGIIRL